MERRRVLAPLVLSMAQSLALSTLGCETVDPGEDFDVADVVYDESFYYCRIEPMLFASRCGPGDPAQGDTGGGCHFNVTSFRLRDYAPLVADSCGGGIVPGVAPPAAARENYTVAQTQMALNPDLAALLNRPTGKTSHPRVIFGAQSPEADLIRQWATQYSTQ